MKHRLHVLLCAAGAITLGRIPSIHAAAPVLTEIATVPRLTVQSDAIILNQIQCTNSLSQGNWATLTNLLVTQSPYWFADLSRLQHPSH